MILTQFIYQHWLAELLEFHQTFKFFRSSSTDETLDTVNLYNLTFKTMLILICCEAGTEILHDIQNRENSRSGSARFVFNHGQKRSISLRIKHKLRKSSFGRPKLLNLILNPITILRYRDLSGRTPPYQAEANLRKSLRRAEFSPKP